MAWIIGRFLDSGNSVLKQIKLLLIMNSVNPWLSNHPPAEPGALIGERLKGALKP